MQTYVDIQADDESFYFKVLKHSAPNDVASTDQKKPDQT